MTWVRRRPRSYVPTTMPDQGARPATDGGEAPVPRLPHERDEQAQAPQAPTAIITQAHDDLEAGLVDTDCRGSATGRDCTPELAALLKPRPEAPRR
jgi:hypothetical protein